MIYNIEEEKTGKLKQQESRTQSNTFALYTYSPCCDGGGGRADGGEFQHSECY